MADGNTLFFYFHAITGCNPHDKTSFSSFFAFLFLSASPCMPRPVPCSDHWLSPRNKMDSINAHPTTSPPCLYITICNAESKHQFCFSNFKFARLTHHYYNIFMGNPLTSGKDLSISLLKLLECRMQWYIDSITWTSRPYFRLITGFSFAVFVLCRLNHIRCIRVTHSSLNR